MKKYAFWLTLFFPFTTFASTLEVSQFLHSSVLPKNGIQIPFLTITATARDGDVRIQGINVRRNGLSEDKDVEHLIAKTNDFRKSLRKDLNDGVAELNFRNPIFIPKDESSRITIYGNISMEFPNGRTIFFVMDGINSDAEEIIPVDESEHPIRTLQETLTKRKRRPYRIECKNRVCVKIPR